MRRHLGIRLLLSLLQELLMVGDLLEDLLILALDAFVLVLHLGVFADELLVLCIKIAELSLKLHEFPLQHVGVVRVELG